MTDQAEHFDDELLSAYVDGELTGEQLALVEQRLINDPEARQLVDELRALSQELQSLPQETLGDDLRATIMQRAERSMLLGADAEPTRPPSDDGSSRHWVWAATAIAAALLLMFVTPGDELELKPVANVKPIPGVPPAGEMRLEAVESEAVMRADAAVAAADPTDHAGDADAALEEAAVPSVGLPAERTAVIEAPAVVRSRAVRVPPAGSTRAVANEVVSDAIDPAFQVHITLNEGESNFDNFNRMLVSNGIELEEANDEANDEADANKQMERRGQSAGAQFAKGRNIRRLKKSLQTVQEEVLLVEAPPANIENVLLGCSLDTRTCASVRVEAEGEKSAQLPIENVNQYSRSGERVPLSQQSSWKKEKQAIAKTQQGRAMRLNADQYQYQPDGQFNLQQKLLTKGKLAVKQTAQSPVQVLFILQQALGEPSAAGGKVSSGSER